MDGNRRLGWIAIAIGTVALVVALIGLGRESRSGEHGRGWSDHGSYGQSLQAQPDDGFERGNDPRGQAPFGPGRSGFGGDRDDFGPRHGRGGFLLLPFLVFGGLVKLALFVGTLFFVLRLIGRGRRGGPGGPFGRRGPGGHGWAHDHDHPHTPAAPPAAPAPQHRPGPEPYTGETTNL